MLNLKEQKFLNKRRGLNTSLYNNVYLSQPNTKIKTERIKNKKD